MARILGLDIETTGLEIGVDQITELGYVLWDTDKKAPLLLHNALIYDDSYSASRVLEASKITGLDLDTLKTFGNPIARELELLEYNLSRFFPTHIVAHNAHKFDKPFLLGVAAKLKLPLNNLYNTPWIDTIEDIPFASEIDSRKLKHLATDHGFLNPFSHRAVFDVLTMLKILSHYNFSDVEALSLEPFIVVRAMVAFQNKNDARARKFSWNAEEKIWVKRIRERDFEKERLACNFKLEVLKA